MKKTGNAGNKLSSTISFYIKDIKKYKGAYLLVLPVLVYYLVFLYKPMYGVLIAFKNFSPAKGIWGSEWVGFQHFIDFFGSYYFTLRVKSSCNFRKRSKAQNAPIKNDCFFEFGAFCIENCQSSALIMDFASSDAHEYIWLQMNPGSEAKDDLFAS